MKIYLRGLAYQLPQTRCTNEDLVRLNPTWNADAIYAKTGIRSRSISAHHETAGDLGYQAAQKLFEEFPVDSRCIDALLFCTQSPDFPLPATACILQARLGLPQSCAALDFNLGCSGFTYGIWLASSLIRSNTARNVLLITGDTLSKYCDPHNLATATIFGDGAAAVWLSADPDNALAEFGPTVVGTDGRGAEQLIVRTGGARHCATGVFARIAGSGAQTEQPSECLYMNGPQLFAFTLREVQQGIQQLLEVAGLDWGQIDLFLMHQANRFLLEQLRAKMGLPSEKMPIDVETLGNTSSATIPILMCRCRARGILRPDQRCMLVGFGVGFSWAMSLLRWGPGEPVC